MFTARTNDGGTHPKVLSFYSTDQKVNYHCSCCQEPVYLSLDTTLGVNRFFHALDSKKRCRLKARDTQAYFRCQLGLFHALKNAGIPVLIDERIQPSNHVYAPLMVRLNNTWCAIEIDRPGLSKDQVIERSHFYRTHRIPVLWLFLDGKCDSRTLYTLKPHEQAACALQDNLLLFWDNGLSLSLCRVYPHHYYPTKKSYRQKTPKSYKRIVRLLFAPQQMSLPSLIPQTRFVNDIPFLFLVSPITYDWPLFEKPIRY